MSNIPTNPETIADLRARFESFKTVLTEEWADQNILIPPTDKEVWGQMKAIATQRKEEAMADDMEYYVFVYQNRMDLIDEVLKNL